MMVISTSPSATREAFEQFSERTEKEFTEGSGILPCLYKECAKLIDEERGSEVHEALNWEYKRERQTNKSHKFGAIALNQ